MRDFFDDTSDRWLKLLTFVWIAGILVITFIAGGAYFVHRYYGEFVPAIAKWAAQEACAEKVEVER